MDQYSGGLSKSDASSAPPHHRENKPSAAEEGQQILVASYRHAWLPRKNPDLRCNEVEFIVRFSPQQLKAFGLKYLEFIVPPRLTAYLSRAGGTDLVIGGRSINREPSLRADAPGFVSIGIRYQLLAPDEQAEIKKIVVNMSQALALDMRRARRMDASFGPCLLPTTPPKRNLDPIRDFHFLSAQKAANEPRL